MTSILIALIAAAVALALATYKVGRDHGALAALARHEAEIETETTAATAYIDARRDVMRTYGLDIEVEVEVDR